MLCSCSCCVCHEPPAQQKNYFLSLYPQDFGISWYSKSYFVGSCKNRRVKKNPKNKSKSPNPRFLSQWAFSFSPPETRKLNRSQNNVKLTSETSSCLSSCEQMILKFSLIWKEWPTTTEGVACAKLFHL